MRDSSQSWQKVSCEAQAAQAEPWELRQPQLSWEAHAKQQRSREMGEHRAIADLPGIWVRRGERTSHNTDNRERGWARQGEPTGSMAKASVDHTGLLSELRRGFVPGEVSSKQGLSSYVPSWAGERGEDT